jgi:hypothetical protein
LTEKALKRSGFHKPELTVQLQRVMSAILNLVEPVGITRSAMLNAVVDAESQKIGILTPTEFAKKYLE